MNVYDDTIFVIGAGAHVPYKMPTSKMLSRRILDLKLCPIVDDLSNKYIKDVTHSEHYREKIRICELIRDLEILEGTSEEDFEEYRVGEKLEEFLIAFGGSQMYSIDSYLANHIDRLGGKHDKAHVAIGKLLISYFITNDEMKSKIGFHEPDWIQYLINEFLCNKNEMESFFNKPPRIYTFNYDNILEKSLIYHLMFQHGLREAEAIQRVESLGIIHIYGKIPMAFDFRSAHSVSHYKVACESIKVVGEERAELSSITADFEKAVSLSYHVYFLGFGYDKKNCELLFDGFKPGYSQLNKETLFHTTTCGLSKYKINRICDLSPLRMRYYEQGADCLTLISEKAEVFKKKRS